MNYSRIVRWVLLLGVLVGIGYLVFGKINRGEKKKEQNAQQSKAPRQLLVDGFVVRTSSLSNSLEASGTLQSNEETNIQSEISARVIRLFFREGQAIAKGAVLVKLYDTDLTAQLLKLRTQRQLAQRTLERQQYLLSRGGVSQQETDVAAAQVSSFDADIALTQSQIDRTQIRAPYNGVIGLRYVSEGTVVSPSTVIASFQQVNPLKMDFSVPEKYSDMLRVGDPVQFSVASDSGMFRATVYAIEPRVESNTRTVKLRARVPNPGGRLRPGQFARVRLELSRTPDALLVPSQAIIPGAREKRVIVARAGKAIFLSIETGVREAALVQITKGIQVGDTVVTSGVLQLKPDAALKVVRLLK